MGNRLVPALLVALALTGCSSGSDKPSGPDPAPAASALAAGLAKGDLSGVVFQVGKPKAIQKEYDGIVAGLGDLTPKISVRNLDETTDTAASATLAWSWPVSDQPWTYDSTATLALVGGAWQVAWDPSVVEASLGPSVTLDATTLTSKRAPILGAGGLGLMIDRPVVRFGVDRTKIGAAGAPVAARRLARLVGVDTAPYVKQVKGAGPKAFVEAIVFRKDEVPAAVTNGYTSIKGVSAIAGSLPLAPTRDFAAPILGRVGEVTAEMIKDHPAVYHLGDLAGISGLEARYDDQLRGSPGVQIDAVGSDGKHRKLYRTPAVKGLPLKLTLDGRLQTEAERLLAGVKPASALVAIRPSTGAILVAANGPGNNGYNDATYGRFAPGSTFKTVASLALIRKGLSPSSPVTCPTSVNVNGKVFTNDSYYPASANGRITLASALANSCNTAYIGQRTRLGDQDLVDAAATLGMGVDHDLGFPAYFGNVAPPTSETTKAADMIGQGQILASPMTMATVLASVVAGHTVVPELVTSVQPTATTSTPLTGSEDATIKTLLRGVVTGGTGLGLKDIPGPPVIAKTGTAEFDRGGKRLTHAWMIGAQGDLAVCAFVDVGTTGAGTAGPILEAFLRSARGFG
ncbi:MAG: penicillin-binding transpeptidase domain-containing protein [Nocardioides sp.]